jgi:hypothetical protein
MEEAEGVEGINDEDQPEGVGNDEGPSTLHDGSNIVLDTIKGR